MEIYIFRDGSQSGPFSEETIRRLLQEQSVTPGDLAWQPGAPQWIPLQEVLATPPKEEPSPASAAPAPIPVAGTTPVSTPTPISGPDPTITPATQESPSPVVMAPEIPETPAPAKAATAAASPEPATAKQKAFLGYMGIPVPGDIAKDQAALLVSETMENPKDPSRLAKWHEDRFRLHPELFAAELQAKKESRAGRFFELAQTVGAKCFNDLTKAHCQVLVGFLDVKYPNWDAHESDAAWHYFFPAIAEKFPDLVTKEWRGKLKYPTGPKVASELKNRSGGAVSSRARTSPLWALLQGLGIGAVALAVVAGGIRLMHAWPTSPAAKSASVSSAAPAIPPAPPAPNPVSAAPPAPEVAPATADAPPAATPPVPPATPAAPATADATSPAAAPASPAPGADASPSPVAPPPANSTATAIPPPPDVTAGKPPASADAPPATAKPPASSLDALFAGANSAPPAPASATPPAAAPVPPAAGKKASVTLTKAIEVPVPFGKAQLPAGTQLKFIAQDGAFVKVDYLNMVVSVPVNATDLNADAP